jgi:hypothetical protein
MAASILETLAQEAAASISETSGRELRAAPRVSARFPASIGPQGALRPSTIVDLSATGCAVAWASEVELGEVFQVEFQLPDADRTDIACVGLVRSVRRTEMGRVVGLEFHNMPPPSRRAVASFVRSTLCGDGPSEARRHWSAAPDLGAATMVSDEEKSRPVLRLAPGFLDLYCEVAKHIAETEMIFVPAADTGLGEGERLYLELVAPSSHAIFRLLAEVVWSANTGLEDEHGVGLRIAGLSAMDRFLLKESVRYMNEDADRYR